jgi:2-polyprenyl-3-methyl-5-hydroxy-6-metoxy-1,4-benzoquinol methylase
MSQNISGIHKIFSYPLIYSLVQIIMSGVSVRSTLVKKIINKNAKILDIGCGTGKILESLPAVDYYGYDISKKYINYAKKKYKSKRNKFYHKKFNINEVDNIPKIDFILLFGVIHHLEDEELHELFPVLKKVLKKNGKIITCDPIYIKKQNIISHFLIKNDVGKNVRNKENYLKLLTKHFRNVKFNIKHQIFIPYTWFSTLCIK